MCRWKLLQLGLDDHYKRLNEGKGKERLPTTQVYLTANMAMRLTWKLEIWDGWQI